MERHILLVQTKAVEGHDEEFNDWYTNTHLTDVLNLDGFVAATRYRFNPTSLHPGEPNTPAPYEYVAVYEIEGDLDAAVQSLADARAGMYISPAMDSEKISLLYTPITERRTHS
jgi:hypothetical protein